MMKDVGDGKVVGERSVDQGNGSAGHGKEAADTGPTRSFGKPVRSNAATGAYCELAQRHAAGEEGVGA